MKDKGGGYVARISQSISRMAARVGLDGPGILVPMVGQKAFLQAALLLLVFCAANHSAPFIGAGSLRHSLDLT
jgi:hypothetical protein